MSSICRISGLCCLVALLGGCAFSTRNKDLARLQREVEDLQDQVYMLERKAEEMTRRIAGMSGSTDPGVILSRQAPTPTPPPYGQPEVSPTRTVSRNAPRLVAASGHPAPSEDTSSWSEPPEPEMITEETLPPSRRDGGDDTAPPSATPEPSPIAAKPPPARSPDPLYAKGLKSLTLDDFNSAITHFEEFIDTNPDSDLADNAQFFIAEAYLRAENYPQAIVEYNRVLDLYPSGDAVPEALFKIGHSYGELNDRRNAGEYYRRVIEQYPDSSAAFTARRALQSMD